MPSKKKKYNARFPPARIKKIMQTDEEVGKVAAPVPVIIYILLHPGMNVEALELFVESLLKKSVQVTMARSAKTLSPAHLKQCVMAESRFDFLRELLASVPDIQGDGDESPLVGVLPPTPSSLTPVSPYGIPPRMHPLSAPISEVPAQRGRGRPRGRPRRTQAVTPSLGRGAAPKRGMSTTTESEDEEDDSDEEDDDDEEGNSKDSAQVHP
nr:EOG090X0H1B [Triops cancriformis]